MTCHASGSWAELHTGSGRAATPNEAAAKIPWPCLKFQDQGREYQATQSTGWRLQWVLRRGFTSISRSVLHLIRRERPEVFKILLLQLVHVVPGHTQHLVAVDVVDATVLGPELLRLNLAQ